MAKKIEKPLYNYKAVATNVVDGDTLDLCIDLGFSIGFKMRVRLLGINTPELKAKDAAIREQAVKAKARLVELAMNQSLVIQTVRDEQDKYGRYLAKIFLPDGKCCNDILLGEGLAVPMDD